MLSKAKSLIKSRFPRLVPVYSMLYWNLILRPRWWVLGPRRVFTLHFQRNGWAGAESISGQGSSFGATEPIRTALPALLREFSVRTMLDIPCGDGRWMSSLDLPLEVYVGADIVPGLVELNRTRRGENSSRRFLCLDLTKDLLPTVDLVFCRDCLMHLSYKHIAAAIANVKRSGATYLLTSTFTEADRNRNIVTGEFRPINLQREPFTFGPPLRVVPEGWADPLGFRDKCMALWPVRELPDLS
jgi:SAM-dependent methyltransferase